MPGRSDDVCALAALGSPPFRHCCRCWRSWRHGSTTAMRVWCPLTRCPAAACAARQDWTYAAREVLSRSKAEAIDNLVAGLRSMDMTVQATSARGLARLSANNADNKVMVAAAGAIPPLVALLRSSSACVQRSASGALRNLSFNDDNRIKVAAAGAIPPLVALLRSSSTGVQEQAAGALTNLSANNDNQVKVAAAGAIPPLVALLSSSSAGVQEQAARALTNLSANNDNQVKVAAAGARSARSPTKPEGTKLEPQGFEPATFGTTTRVVVGPSSRLAGDGARAGTAAQLRRACPGL